MKTKRARVCLVVLSSALAAPSFGASEGAIETSSPIPFVFRFSDHALVASRKDPEDPTIPDQNTILHENQLEAAYGQVAATLTYTNLIGLETDSERTKAFVLEKKRVVWKPGAFEITAGDAYQQLGRGIALATYRDPVFGLDTTIEGGHVRYKSDAWDVNAFAGRLNAYSVPVAVNPMSNPLLHRSANIAAVAASFDTGFGRLGGHVASTWVKPNTSDVADRQFRIAGATYETTFGDGAGSLYVESNVLLTDYLTLPIEQPNGYGSYGAVAWTGDGWRVKVEGKDYRDFYYDFRRPPTLEEDVVISLNTQNVSAGKVLFEKRLNDGRSSVWASTLVGEDRFLHTDIVHGVVGTKLKIGKRGQIEAKAGYRDELGKNDLTHAMVRSKIPTWTSQSLELGARKQRARRGLDLGEPTFDDRNYVDVAYNFSERWNVAVGYEYVPSNPGNVHFANASANYRNGGFAGRVFVGQTSGGTQCSGGICRQVPPFSGAMVETTVTF